MLSLDMYKFNILLYLFNLGMLVLLLIILLSVCVAFFTLFERKIMGGFHYRKGPNKVGLIGIFQPFSDAMKLFSKEIGAPYLSVKFLFISIPIFAFYISLLCWLGILEIFNEWYIMEFSFLLIFCLLSLNVYFILVGGWISKSVYSIISSIRGVAQAISYEIVLIFLILMFLLSIEDLFITKFINFQEYFWYWWEFYLLQFTGFLIILSELNRAPFDLLEGESELVSGYNVEFGGNGFGMFFMMENLMIIFWSILFIYLFYGGIQSFFLMELMKIIFLIYLFIWLRMIYPRYRYDKLMELMWVSILLFYMLMFLFIYGIKFMFYCYLY
uniref:NADH dehydrogenase subunit 1 n=1 Tax=Sirex nitobei TaxID=1602346 RepID=UPI0023D8B81F|nr:NADH dehydrogenase subunit 1 [Sirex nitobei]WDR47220.1 NADH dehydrogenase subunit 1 [Sirex nitobei]